MPVVLTLLRIKNLALVEELGWEIAPGFTAVTGETGAGKSIIIGALQLLLGERADKSLTRTGADFCTVEAVWTAKGQSAACRGRNRTMRERSHHQTQLFGYRRHAPVHQRVADHIVGPETSWGCAC